MTGSPNSSVPFARLRGRAFIPIGIPEPSRTGRRASSRGTSWPAHGAMYGAAAYALPAPEPGLTMPPTDGYCLSTPDTSPEAPNAGSHRRSHPSGLGNQVRALLPTPGTSDAVGAGQNAAERIAAGHQVNLADAVCGITPRVLLPTPRARDGKGADRNPNGVDLNQAVALLPTPRASDATKGSPHQRGSSGDLTLTSAVHLLPTPSVADALGGHRSRSGARSGELLLPGLAQSLAANLVGRNCEASE